MYGGVETGGTKVVCVIGTGPAEIVDSTRIELTDPAATLRATIDFFARAVAAGIRLDAVGIGSFGPLELRAGHPRYGRITTTTKSGWSDTDVVGPFAEALGVPIGLDTDVNAAALGEGRWGAARGLRSFVYLTLGTGIGGGAVVEGRLLHGLRHPEMGHIGVPRRSGDRLAGVCRFHRDCLEGLASGPAVAARFDRRAEQLEGADRAAASALVGFYLASAVRTLVYSLAPERVVVGGGLSMLPGLFEAARTELARQLGGYPGLPEHDEAAFIAPALLGQSAGPAGALVLAELAAARSS